MGEGRLSDALERIEAWYAARLDGDWEHRYGLSVESCDNPGWWLRATLPDDAATRAAFAALETNAGRVPGLETTLAEHPFGLTVGVFAPPGGLAGALGLLAGALAPSDAA